MKTSFAAGACLALLCGQARAQVTVIDPASIYQQVQQLAQQAKAYLLEAQKYAVQTQQYTTELEQLNGFIHDPSLGAATGLMNTAGLSNSLPVNPMAVASLTSGFNSLSSLSGLLGKVSQLNGLVNTNFATNHVYSPTDGSWNSQQLIANGNAIAGAQGAAQSAYQDLQNHLPILQALRDRLNTATNPKDVADAQSQIQAEAAWTNNLQSELAAIDVSYRAAADSRVQRDNEAMNQSFDNFIASANALPGP
jgi:hypothetical protein